MIYCTRFSRQKPVHEYSDNTSFPMGYLTWAIDIGISQNGIVKIILMLVNGLGFNVRGVIRKSSVSSER